MAKKKTTAAKRGALTVIAPARLREQLNELRDCAEDGCNTVSTMYELTRDVAARFSDNYTRPACALRSLETAFEAMAFSHEAGWLRRMGNALGEVEQALSGPLPTTADGAARSATAGGVR